MASQHTILVVDDDPQTVEAIVGVLKEDYGVLGTTSPLTAITMLTAGPVHVIISDQRMPEMTGLELLRHAQAAHPDVVRLLLTGYADIRAVIDAINDKTLHRYITKPWDSEELRTVVREACAHHGLVEDQKRLRAAELEAAALRREMELAKQVQEALIPKSPPNVVGLEAVGWTRAASSTGGDCYDLWKLAGGGLGIFLGDASGHGLAPAWIISQVRTLVRALSEADCDPHHLLGRINSRLVQDLAVGRFVTAFLGFLSPDGNFRWSSAGHGPNFLRLAEDLPLQLLEPTAFPLGIMDEWDEASPAPAHVEPTGSLFLLSDGLFEAFNDRGDQFGVNRVRETLNGYRDRKPDEVVAALRDAVQSWQGVGEQLDDQTMVVVRRSARPRGEREVPGVES